MALLISIITVNYNNSYGLEETIASVLKQQYENYEFIIIDGGSTDASLEVIRKYSPKLAYWVSEKDEGIYPAMNKGIQNAKGDYLMFLNSGDRLSGTTVLQDCSFSLLAKPDTDILYGDVYAINTLKDKVKWSYPEKMTLTFFKDSTINHQASLVKASLFSSLGLYSEKHGMASDYLFFLNCLLKDKRYVHFKSPMVEYDITGVSAADGYKGYINEMSRIWSEIVPIWAQAIVEENKSLNGLVGSRIIKFAIAINGYLRRFFRK